MKQHEKSFEYFQAQADAAAAAADKATLVNVRERELRSEETWRALAEHARKVSKGRALVERERAARREAVLQAEEEAESDQSIALSNPNDKSR
ncbi:hypothetical protein ACRAQ7_06865 [Erythrobacter sp. W53]|uniref:hypothetical protein n=1 Tax=Erythrobacter sp. W53 TaxID=3425947 RepID=UPI003D768BF2